MKTEVCRNCASAYACWFAANDIWNCVIPERVGMLCPNCFLARAERAGFNDQAWKLQPEFYEPADAADVRQQVKELGEVFAKWHTTVYGYPPSRDEDSRRELFGAGYSAGLADRGAAPVAKEEEETCS